MLRAGVAICGLILSMHMQAESAAATAATTDPVTGLVIAPGWEHVRAHCGACHSYRLITSQRGDASFWVGVIRWMQRTQSFWQLEPALEAQIVDYLAVNYDETDWGRRPPLSVSLLPAER
jgi:mono/diheme cytochrome c family protein